MCGGKNCLVNLVNRTFSCETVKSGRWKCQSEKRKKEKKNLREGIFVFALSQVGKFFVSGIVIGIPSRPLSLA